MSLHLALLALGIGAGAVLLLAYIVTRMNL